MAQGLLVGRIVNMSRLATALSGAAADAPGTRRAFLRALSRPRSRSTLDLQQGPYWIRLHRQAMACRFEITLAAADSARVTAARTALDEIDALEQELSIFRDTSAISLVNRRAALEPVRVPSHVIDLLEACQRLHVETSGAFDVTSTPLSRCWGFLLRQGRVPTKDEIDIARARVGLDGVHLDRQNATVSFTRSGIELNLGAVGKGYALDRVGGGLRQSGVDHALLSAGCSSLLAVGGRGRGWPVDVVSPLAPEHELARLWIRDAAVGTSGGGAQFVIVDGRRYGHIIDPRTGWPARGVLSVTVVASSAATADALSTAIFVGGVGLAERYCAEHADVLALVTPDGGGQRPIVVGTRFGTRVERA